MTSNTGAAVSGTAYGVRNYSVAAGATIDVVESDANALEGQNFLRIGWVGPTASRPKAADLEFSSTPAAMKGFRYIDTTLGYEIVCDGAGIWHNPVTGAAV
jgi:hypothetical protein